MDICKELRENYEIKSSKLSLKWAQTEIIIGRIKKAKIQVLFRALHCGEYFY